MSKVVVIKKISNQILTEYNIRYTMSDKEIFNIGKKILKTKINTPIEKRIIKRTFAIIEWILKMKRYWIEKQIIDRGK